VADVHVCYQDEQQHMANMANMATMAPGSNKQALACGRLLGLVAAGPASPDCLVVAKQPEHLVPKAAGRYENALLSCRAVDVCEAQTAGATRRNEQPRKQAPEMQEGQRVSPA
jgi:hypothetical protein